MPSVTLWKCQRMHKLMKKRIKPWGWNGVTIALLEFGTAYLTDKALWLSVPLSLCDNQSNWFLGFKHSWLWPCGQILMTHPPSDPTEHQLKRPQKRFRQNLPNYAHHISLARLLPVRHSRVLTQEIFGKGARGRRANGPDWNLRSFAPSWSVRIVSFAQFKTDHKARASAWTQQRSFEGPPRSNIGPKTKACAPICALPLLA